MAVGSSPAPNTWRVALGAGAVSAELLNGAHQHHLDRDDQEQRQRVVHNAPRHGEVVQGAAVEHLSAGLEPGAANNVGTVSLQALRDDDTGSGKHGPAGVQQLVGAVLGDGLVILAQAQGVVAVAAQAGEGERLGELPGLCNSTPPMQGFALLYKRCSSALQRSTPIFADCRCCCCRSAVAALLATWAPKHSLARQLAVQVGGQVIPVQQTAGQEQSTVRACAGMIEGMVNRQTICVDSRTACMHSVHTDLDPMRQHAHSPYHLSRSWAPPAPPVQPLVGLADLEGAELPFLAAQATEARLFSRTYARAASRWRWRRVRAPCISPKVRLNTAAAALRAGPG